MSSPEEAAAAVTNGNNVKSPNDTIVTVTGATGYLATHIIHILLAQGYQVRGTVRDPEAVRTEHLNDPEEFCPEMRESGGTLTLFTCDLTVEGSFDEAVDGADYVMHTASPCLLDVSKVRKPQQIVDTSVAGVTNVISAVEKTDSVKRVILTSSTTTVYHEPRDKKSRYYDEGDWNDRSTIYSNVYFKSKVEEEKVAWELKKKAKKNWEMTALLASILLGPSKHPRPSKGSYGFMTAFLSGIFKFGPNMFLGWTDVNDFAKLHVLSMQHEKCFERVMCVNDVLSLQKMGKIVKKNFKKEKFPVPKMSFPGCFYIPFTFKFIRIFNTPFLPMLRQQIHHRDPKVRFNNSLLLENFDFEFSSMEESVVQMVQSCIDNDMIPYKHQCIFF